MQRNVSQSTEKDTEAYYDSNDNVYRSLWDNDGRVHWGYFDESNQHDFQKAGRRMTEVMMDMASINQLSKVLDVGCGNGTITIDIVKKSGCAATGIDISGVRIHNARHALASLSHDVKKRLRFDKGSATALPYEDGSFTHAWSMGTIYHVPEKESALREIYRVLQPNGVFVFEDLFKPKEEISEQTRRVVYEGLKFDTHFSFSSYQKFLQRIGFEIREAHDLSQQLKKNYKVLSGMIEDKLKNKQNSWFQAIYQEWLGRYAASVEAVENNELGWGLFLCRKHAP